VLHATNRVGEAEPLYRRALTIRESALGPEDMLVAVSLNSMAQFLAETNRMTEAEPLLRRALAIQEQRNPDDWGVVVTLNNLAYLSMKTRRLKEAEPLFRRALTTGEKALGADHWTVATLLNNLAMLLQETKRFDEAEPLYRRALTVSETSLGFNHANVARDTNNLAWLLHVTGRPADAEPLYWRSLTIFETSLGSGHPSLALPLTSLAGLFAERGDWAAAVALHTRAKPILTGLSVEVSDRNELAKVRLAENVGPLRAHARAAYRAHADGVAAREEGFELAQWALQTGAAYALAQMSVRFAKGAGPLAQLVRDRQDLVIRRQDEDKLLLAAVGKADLKTADTARATIGDLDTKLHTIDKQLAAEFPEYASLANPKPLTIAVVQGLLRADEALVVFLDVPRFGQLPEETLAWAVTKTQARWLSIPLGTEALNERVAKLRCGLDREGLWSWSGQRWLAKGERCRDLRPEGLSADEPLPFELGAAHELYAQLLGPLADMTRGKSLIIVPSGPLTSLPFHVLVTEGLRDVTFQNAAWLALKQPITVLPSVASLQALRKLPPSEAKEPYIAFGNPLLDGSGSAADQKRADQARAKQTCPQDLESLRQRVVAAANGMPALATIFRGGGVDLGALRAQTPLPETADEVCAVAKSLGALGRERETVWLGARATETNLKAFSKEGKLARHRVLHFATHGLLAGETEALLSAKAEPALMLTPPKDGTTPAELEQDDGLLMASEVAQLELDADWVVLSACNTAAGDKGDAEALSGLARAFFYAKARALLVSHWYVSSDAAVKLTTGTFAELRADPKLGRAEALRRSMAALITMGRPHEAHPEQWAPFVLVGEGAR
jgi:CHAT domain-containing protein/tetratricopeptide (TPR) repeat protein